MRKIIFCLALIASLTLFAVQKANAAEGASYQIVITSDGNQILLPADMSEESVVFFLEWYEYCLEFKEWYNRQPKPYPC